MEIKFMMAGGSESTVIDSADLTGPADIAAIFRGLQSREPEEAEPEG